MFSFIYVHESSVSLYSMPDWFSEEGIGSPGIGPRGKPQVRNCLGQIGPLACLCGLSWLLVDTALHVLLVPFLAWTV